MLDALVIDLLDTPPAVVVDADTAVKVGRLVDLDLDLGLSLARAVGVDVDVNAIVRR